MKKLSFIKIPDGEYEIFRNGEKYSLKMKDFSIMESLVTIEEYLEWYEELGLCNHIGGTYKYFNHINPTNSIYLNTSTEKYVIKEKFYNTPMRGVTWLGAFEFAKYYNGRLPSELEWEICARAGHTDYAFPWGNDPPTFSKANDGNFIGYPTPSCNYSPNEWGLFDMAGNMREWCMDYYHPDYPFLYNQKNNHINSMYRVIKGGAWDKTENFLHCSFSEGKWERIGTMSLGFRVVRNGMYTA